MDGAQREKRPAGRGLCGYTGRLSVGVCVCVCNRNDNQMATSMSAEDARTRDKLVATDQKESYSNSPTKT